MNESKRPKLCGGPAIDPDIYFAYYGDGAIPTCMKPQDHSGQCAERIIYGISDAMLAD